MTLAARTLIAGLLLIVALVLGGYGGWSVWDQHRLLTTAKTVQGVIEQSRVRVSRGSKSTSYTAEVSYSYQVGGQGFRGDSVFPVHESTSQWWAEYITRKYYKGLTTTVWYDAADPARSFLEHRYAAEPYLVVSVGAGVLAAAAGIWRSRKYVLGDGGLEPVTEGGGGWWRLQPERSLEDILAQRRAVALSLILPLAFPAHYMYMQLSDAGVGAWLVGGAHLAGAVVAAIMWGMAKKVNRRFVDPVVLTDRQWSVPGDTVAVRVAASVLQRVDSGTLAVGLVCRETYRERRGTKVVVGQRVRWEEWQPEEAIETIDENGIVTRDFELGTSTAVPEGTPPAGRSKYPYYTWYVQVRIKVRHHLGYRGEFPIPMWYPDHLG